jgi:subtilase family serine protease
MTGICTGFTCLSPTDIKSVYGLSSTSLTGSGQTVALVEFDGYRPSDITTYEDGYNIAHILVTPVSVDGAQNIAGPNFDEVELDIQMVAALAPGVSQILVYECPNSLVKGIDMLNQIATDNTAKSISSSWGLDEPETGLSIINAESPIFQRMAVQGQSFYVASGDSGAYDDRATITVEDPASQPFVTSVGGTSLSGTVAAPIETTWNDCGTGECLQDPGLGSSGGGISVVWPIPSYQMLVNTTANGGSATARNVPDVALNADEDSAPYSVYFGAWTGEGGTSAAAPLWAAYTAILNQNAGSPIGFINPGLYQLAASTSSSTFFHDITSGGDNGKYSPGAGYDNVTGIGSFKGAALIDAASTLNVPVPTLNNIYAFPNPWDARNPLESDRKITFANGTKSTLPDGATIKIFTISGFLVKTLTVANGTAIWQDLTNDSGKRVASGLYFYLASSGSNQVRGTIAIIK